MVLQTVTVIDCLSVLRGNLVRVLVPAIPPSQRETQSAPKAAYTHARSERMADAAGVAAVLQPPRRALAAQERFKWTPKQSFSYLATFFIATWLGAFLITFLLVQVLLRMS